MTKIILASTSKYRKQQMESLGVPFESHKPLVDEEALKVQFEGETCQSLVVKLAQAKAQSLARLHPEAIVIGSDQAVAIDNRILGKRKDFSSALEQLQSMQGKSHSLFTAVAFCHRGEVLTHLNETVLTMRSLTDERLVDYIKKDSPFDVAGCYKFESFGFTLFESVKTEDPTAIVGLPLLSVIAFLASKGIAI